MVISKLIERLQEVLSEYGNLNITFADLNDTQGYDITSIIVGYFNGVDKEVMIR